MSERPRAGLPDDADKPTADDLTNDPGGDLELLAITEEYVAAHRAGKRPRLLDFVARYPTHAAALADFATQLQADEALGEGTLSPEDEPASARPLSAGARRALAALLGAPAGETAPMHKPVYDAEDAHADLPSVAETPAPYTPGGQGGGNDERPAGGGGDAAADAAAPSQGSTGDTKNTKDTGDAEGTEGRGRAPGSR